MKKTKQDPPLKGATASQLKKQRRNIDGIDEKILDLINQRLLLAKEIGEIKAQNGNAVVDSSREHKILKRLKLY